MTLTTLARKAHPLSKRHAAKYVLAVRYLRKNGLWVLDKNSRKPAWAHTETQQ